MEAVPTEIDKKINVFETVFVCTKLWPVCTCMCKHSARTCVHVSVCACVCIVTVSEVTPGQGSPVTGAHLRFCKLSSQCAKQPYEDRISHCDLAPEVTEIHLRGQT